ncbi:hypothetical protein LCGC14_1079690 [marine sediment metagenome]|uniref:Uncharacterized protein n=1 Tax=marine sediment metagenome TaxID=412755 RepID=A0A0F9MKB7_9ZZZZ
MHKLVSPNFILALIFVLVGLAMFSVIVWRQLGGNEALFLIIGHTAAWIEFIAIFYFRKKPPAN